MLEELPPDYIPSCKESPSGDDYWHLDGHIKEKDTGDFPGSFVDNEELSRMYYNEKGYYKAGYEVDETKLDALLNLGSEDFDLREGHKLLAKNGRLYSTYGYNEVQGRFDTTIDIYKVYQNVRQTDYYYNRKSTVTLDELKSFLKLASKNCRNKEWVESEDLLQALNIINEIYSNHN